MGQVPEKLKGGELQSIGGGTAPLMWYERRSKCWFVHLSLQITEVIFSLRYIFSALTGNVIYWKGEKNKGEI